MGLSNYALTRMGFTPIPDHQTIEAHFKSINVYEVTGINCSDASVDWHNELLRKNDNFSFSLGVSVNSICQKLIGDDYADDEDQWRADTKSTPPYLVVVTWLSESHECKEGYWKIEGDKLLTYNCFSNAKLELFKREKDIVHPFVGSLISSLSSVTRTVNCRPVSREVYADTNNYRHLKDVSVNLNATGSCSYSISTDDMSAIINLAMDSYNRYPPKVGRFFYLGMQEDDSFKKFRYYFLVLEVLVHHVYKSLKGGSEIKCIPGNLSSVLDCRYSEAKNLLDRFLWCAFLAWRDIEDVDIFSFKQLKKTRDNLSHGEDVNEKKLPIEEATSLIYKLVK